MTRSDKALLFENCWYVLLIAAVLTAIMVTGCGSAPEELPECPDDGVAIFLVGCPMSTTDDLCNDAVGKQHASNCAVHDSDGSLHHTCVASCAQRN